MVHVWVEIRGAYENQKEESSGQEVDVRRNR